MDEIQFRGKRVDTGEWVYGYVFRIWDRVYILSGTINGVPGMTEVTPGTVGQYIGRRDRNGTMMYHGDNVKLYYAEMFFEGEITGFVIWSNIDSAWYLDFGSCAIALSAFDFDEAEPEVVGNIEDNT